MTTQQAILQQKIYIQRRSDRMLGKDRMDYQQFCEAIDELIPAEAMNIKDNGSLISTRDTHKAIAGLMQEQSDKSYYDIYLSIKYNTPLV